MQKQIPRNQRGEIHSIITPDGVGGYSQRFCIGNVSKQDIDKIIQEGKNV